MTNPKVSVLMPSYNHEAYVGATIESVLRQSYSDFEFIIVDDCSTDGTVEVIKKFNDPRIRLFVFDKNTGGLGADAKCIAEARGDYIAIICSDDLYMPDKLEQQVRYLDNEPDCAAVFTLPRLIDEDGNYFKDESHPFYTVFRQPNRTRYEWLNYFFYNGNGLCHPSILAHREVYTEIAKAAPLFVQLPDFRRGRVKTAAQSGTLSR